MIRKDYLKTDIVQSHDPLKVVEKLNALLEEKADCEPQITQEGYHPKIGHYAKVRWSERITIPEDARDRANIKGVNLCCGECPFFVLQNDRRIKHSVCNQGTRTWYEKAACVELYEMIEKGEIELDLQTESRYCADY